MRRPCLASSPKRNRKRLLRNTPGKRTCGRLFRRLSPRLPVDMRVGRPEAAPGAPQISAATEAPKNAAAEVAACDPMRCGFGAVRVGALLGRLRLHLQTERFLAVHRGDILWERGCVGAALALAVIAAAMQDEELDAALATALNAASSRSGGTLRRATTPNLRGEETQFGDGRALGTRARSLPDTAHAPKAGPRELKLKKQIPRAPFEIAKANEPSPERHRNDSLLVSGSTRGAR